MKLLPAQARVAEPWKNGRGQTATVTRADGWRVSVARIDDDAPFSTFPGLGRLLMPLSPGGVVLRVNGRRRPLTALQAGGFDGEDAVQAADLRAPAEVLNLMWRRDDHRGELSAVSVTGALELSAGAGVLVAVATVGELAVAGGGVLGRLDALVLASGESVVVSGSGGLAVVRVADRPSPGDEPHPGTR